MSRVGLKPVIIPDQVKVELSGLNIKVIGPKGNIEKKFQGEIEIHNKDNKIEVKPTSDSRKAKAMWGTARSIIANMVKGVHEGFNLDLELVGVGYRASMQGELLNLALAKSHNTKIMIPSNVEVKVAKQNLINLSSPDKEVLGEFAAKIIRERPPEPYKGKGIKKAGQVIQIKQGKKG